MKTIARKTLVLLAPLARDFGLPGLVALLLALFGLLAIRNATLHQAGSELLLRKQELWLAIGVMVFLLVTAVSRRWYERLVPWLALGIWISLWAVLYLGIHVKGHQYTMTGWFAWNGFFLQPSEFGKPVFVLGMAWLLSRPHWQSANPWQAPLPIIGFLIIWSLPIAGQPDFGCIIVLTVTMLMVWKFSGGSLRKLSLICLVPVVPAATWFLHRHPYLLGRIQGFLSPESTAQTTGWHALQLRNTFAAGGLTGNQSMPEVWNAGYLPLGYSDSIFATIAEGGGFLFAMTIILIFVAWLWYTIRVAGRQTDRFSELAIAGLGGILGLQAFVHFSVNLGLCPATGLTLPFLSYGGSSLVSSFIILGLFQTIRTDRK
jgi:cell division protein FtsW (lipid II flippase)